MASGSLIAGPLATGLRHAPERKEKGKVMGFMYLHLHAGKDGTVHAEVRNDGTLEFSTLGTESSQLTRAPLAVFRIGEFTGLDCISTRDLEREVTRRIGPRGLVKRLALLLSTRELVDMLAERIPRETAG
jgi:hypothetical protein